MRGHIGYLCLQATREGQASHAHVHYIVDGLRDLGWEIDLYQPDYATSAEDPGIWPRIREFIRIQIKLLTNISHYDLIYVRSHFAAFPTAFCANCCDVQMVREVNGTSEDVFLAWPVMRAFEPILRWMMRAQLQWSDAVITVSEGLTEWVKQQGVRGAVRMIPAGVDTELFQPSAESEFDLPDSYVLFFGALAPWQGITLLLQAVQSSLWPKAVRLVIAGDGAMQEEVESAVLDNDSVAYLGRLPYRAMPGLIANAMASLSPQRDLAGRASVGLYPLKVFETMASGVPVIVTDFPGQADVVRKEGCGIVVPPEDPDAIACAVQNLAHDSDRASSMGKNGRRAALAEHSWRNRVEATEDVLRKCINS